MMKIRPVLMQWSGEVMVPDSRFLPLCNRQFAVGENYPLLPVEERSMASHNQYFAAIADGWQNLPENISERWPSEEHLRKWCLVESGYFNELEHEFGAEDEAKRFAIFFRKADDYARIYVHGKKVIIRVAKSQSKAAMGKDVFQASKVAVLDIIESLTGVKPGELMRNAGQSA